MPPISDFLDELLTRWITRGNDLRKEISFQKDLIEPLALAANGNRLAARECRRRDLRNLDETSQDAQARWEERLHRVEEWKNAVTELDLQEGQLHRLIGSVLWLQKARTYQDAFNRRLERKADLLLSEYQALHEKIVAWSEILQERETQMQELKNKEIASTEPLYVSRARKQPEIDFVNEQRAVNETLGKEMQQLRSSLNLTLGRLQKAVQAVESRTAGSQILFEVHKQEIEAALKSSGHLLQARREQILSDALLFEGCRSALRRIQEMVRGLRCIEDISLPRAKSGWRKIFPIH